MSDHLTSRWDLGRALCVAGRGKPDTQICVCPPPGTWVRAQAQARNTDWVSFLTDFYGPQPKTPCFHV